jgi:hypothetical protein
MSDIATVLGFGKLPLFSCEVDNYVLLFHNDDPIIKYNNIANFPIKSRIL